MKKNRGTVYLFMVGEGIFFLILALFLLALVSSGKAEILPEEDLQASEPAVFFTEGDYEVSSYEELLNALAQAFRHRETSFTIIFDYPTNASSEIERALEDLRCRAPYDYWHYNGMSWSGWGSQVTLTVNYRTTWVQEEELEENLRPLIATIQDLPPYEKVKAIHDWIVNNLEYDTTYSRYTAYEAFFEQRAVCQGYSLLAYKMLTMAGIEASLVEGWGNGGDHMWNMVRLCCGSRCQWFHLDVTWDDPLPGGMLRYDYFLLSEAEILRDHRIKNACGHQAPESYKAWEAGCEESPTQIDVKVNGEDAPGCLRTEESLQITVSFETQEVGREGEFYLKAELPDHSCYCYQWPYTWVACPCGDPYPAYQGPVGSFVDLFLYQAPCASLPKGTYHLYFAMDPIKNGHLDQGEAINDTLFFQIRSDLCE